MSELNYARKLATIGPRSSGTVVFFKHAPPFPPSEYQDWAFYRLPKDEDAVGFHGRIIGECPNQRCIRRKHSPGICDACKFKAGRLGSH
jgi:hypothetical protein